MKLILLGAPGAGKGTQSAIISKKLGIPTISTGHILRNAGKNGDPAGLEAKAYMDEGKLVPDAIILRIVEERLAQSDCQNGYILDGVPRTIAQAEALERDGVHFDVVLSFEVPDETIIKRMSGRRSCDHCGAIYHIAYAPPKEKGKCDRCGGELQLRVDDMPVTVQHRLAVYHAETEPLKEFYRARGNLRTVVSRPTIEETTEVIMTILGMK